MCEICTVLDLDLDLAHDCNNKKDRGQVTNVSKAGYRIYESF